VLGPLANPAGAGRQVVGVADPARVPLLGRALAALGSVHALVVHGEPGMDEVSPIGATRGLEVRRGEVRDWAVQPEHFHWPAGTSRELAGGSPAENAQMVTEVLEGRERGARRSAVLLNAGAAILVGGAAADFDHAVQRATESLDTGAGADALTRLRRASAPRGAARAETARR
jgi:anthranilate phosphoribosyltransferase